MIKDVIIPKVESVRPEFNLMNCLKNWFRSVSRINVNAKVRKIQ